MRIHRWPVTKASDAELWCFLWSAREQTIEQTTRTRVIWDAIAQNAYFNTAINPLDPVTPYGVTGCDWLQFKPEDTKIMC